MYEGDPAKMEESIGQACKRPESGVSVRVSLAKKSEKEPVEVIASVDGIFCLTQEAAEERMLAQFRKRWAEWANYAAKME